MSSTTSKTISTLPDLCLLIIFDSVPLMDIITSVSLTCRRWYSLRHSIFIRRTRLHLIIGKKGTSSGPNCKPWCDSVTCPVLTVKRLKHLTTWFINMATANNNLRQLMLEIGNIRYTEPQVLALGSVCQMLQEWTTNHHQQQTKTSTTSKLQHIDISWPNSSLAYYQLLESDRSLVMRTINGLGTLGLRVLNLDFELIRKYVREGTPFPVLATLDRLEVNSIELRDDLVEFCRWVGANYARNRRLELILPTEKDPWDQTPVRSDELEHIYRSGAPLAQFKGSFPEPQIYIGDYYDAMYRFFGYFSGLTAFTFMDMIRLSMAQMSRCLAQVPNLERLHLLYPYIFDSDYVPLRSVRHLTIHLYDQIMRQGVHLWPEMWEAIPHAALFPGLRVLSIQYRQRQFTASYSYNSKKEDYHVDPKLGPADKPLKQVVRPYLTCAQLTEVRFVDRYQDTLHSYKPDQLA